MTATAERNGAAHAITPVWWVHDTLLMAGRNIRHILRAPDLIFTTIFTPIIFFVMFRYVFGGAIQVPGGDYTQYLLPGLLLGMSTFISVPAISVAIASDLRDGVMERFRSLPMTRSSVLAGHTISEGLRSLAGIALLLGLGVLGGFRFSGGVGGFLGAIGLLVLWGFALGCLGALLGLIGRSVEAAQGMAMMLLTPFGFVSSVYVPPDTMPTIMRVIAEHNPITHGTDTIRSLFDGTAPGSSLWLMLAWMGGFIVVCGTLSVLRLRRVVA